MIELNSWRKSSYSDAGGNCVEVASLNSNGLAVRDSKNPGQGALLITGLSARALLSGVKSGRFDLPR